VIGPTVSELGIYSIYLSMGPGKEGETVNTLTIIIIIIIIFIIIIIIIPSPVSAVSARGWRCSAALCAYQQRTHAFPSGRRC
jgi:hypothetical protein